MQVLEIQPKDLVSRFFALKFVFPPICCLMDGAETFRLAGFLEAPAWLNWAATNSTKPAGTIEYPLLSFLVFLCYLNKFITNNNQRKS